MTIFDELEKFIDEHGASSEVKKHVAFIKEQMAVLIRENAMLKSKLSLSIAENKVLETQVRDLEKPKGNNKDIHSTGEMPEK
jgi:regulator of replication initiation timing